MGFTFFIPVLHMENADINTVSWEALHMTPLVAR
jgi:hypothetical protein